jgi:hypothetical protein
MNDPKDSKDSVEETENMYQRESRERARKVERSRDRPSGDRKELDPSPSQRVVQPSNRTRQSQ